MDKNNIIRMKLQKNSQPEFESNDVERIVTLIRF